MLFKNAKASIEQLYVVQVSVARGAQCISPLYRPSVTLSSPVRTLKDKKLNQKMKTVKKTKKTFCHINERNCLKSGFSFFSFVTNSRSAVLQHLKLITVY